MSKWDRFKFFCLNKCSLRRNIGVSIHPVIYCFFGSSCTTTPALHLRSMNLHCLFFKNLRIKKEVINIHSQDAIVIIIGLHNIFCDNNFLERIINLSERSDFLRTLCFIRQRVCRLNIVSGRSKITYKIDFKLSANNLTILISLCNRYYTYIDAKLIKTQPIFRIDFVTCCIFLFYNHITFRTTNFHPFFARTSLLSMVHGI